MITPTRLKIYGPPGSGKTKTAIDMMIETVKDGDKAIFTSFTKQAAYEARSRVPSQYRNKIQVNTLHSLSYKDLDFKKGYVVRDLKPFAKRVGEILEEQDDKTLPRSRLNDILSFLSTWRNKGIEPTLSDLPRGIPWKLTSLLIQEYKKYKNDEAKVDYTDFLTSYIEHGEPLKAEHMFVDEAQDLTALQWRTIEKMARNCHSLSVFGDDDQAIFAFAGSEAKNLMDWPADHIKILDHSYRLPKKIYDVSQMIIQQVRHRFPKSFHHNGSLGNVSLTSTINFDQDFAHHDNYAVLYRNQTMGDWVREELHKRGIPYQSERGPYGKSDQIKAILDWEQWRNGKEINVRSLRNIARYTRMDLKSFDENHGSFVIKSPCPSQLPWHEILRFKDGDVYRLAYNNFGIEAFTKTSKITLSTIHHAKGGEWDKVILLTDMANTTFKEYQKATGREDEDRVWYVGTTRAKYHLQLIRPQRVRNYPLLANFLLERLS